MKCRHGIEEPEGDPRTILLRVPSCCLREILADLQDRAIRDAAETVRAELQLRGDV